MTDTLFDLPNPTPAADSTRRARIVAQRIADGLHPLHGIHNDLVLHPDASRLRNEPGPRCGGCAFRQHVERRRSFPKCQRTDKLQSRSEATDCRAWWPACQFYQPKGTPDE